jgi:hypothetical protein
MKKLFAILTLLTSSFTFACADLANKPAYFTQKGISCGTIVNKIIEPKIIHAGKAYALALDLGDMYGGCPDPNVGCYPPYYNLQKRGNAICKAYGMGRYAKSTGWSPLFHSSHRTPDIMGRLKRVNPTTFAPGIVSINHSRSEYMEVREIWCHKTYPKR